MAATHSTPEATRVVGDAEVEGETFSAPALVKKSAVLPSGESQADCTVVSRVTAEPPLIGSEYRSPEAPITSKRVPAASTAKTVLAPLTDAPLAQSPACHVSTMPVPQQ